MLEELKMDSYKIESEADSNACAESEMSSISETFSEDENSRNRGGTEVKNRMKLRSFKLSRLPSLRSCVRLKKSPSSKCPSLLSDYAASSEQSSPNYTKATSCSDVRKERFQKSARTLTRRSSFKRMKSLSRMSSMKLRRPLMRKSSGETDLKKKLKRARSIKPAGFGSSRPSTRKQNTEYDQPSIILSRDVNPPARYSKAHYQASPSHSESSFNSNDQNKKNSKVARPHSDSSVRVFKRTASLRPQRILTKTTSLKSRRSTMKNGSEVSEISESSIDKATCSSTLKDSKFPFHPEFQLGGSETDEISTIKVCSYSYCSLHGHRHGTLPPLKRFVSMRRRSLKIQKSMIPESRSVLKAKCPKNTRKGAQPSQVIFNRDSTEAAQDSREKSSVTGNVTEANLKGAGSHNGENMNIKDSANLTKIVLGATSKPDLSFEQNKISDSWKAKKHMEAAFSSFNEPIEERCSITREAVKLIHEVSDAERKEEKIVAPSAHNRDDKPVLTVNHHKIMDSSLPELKVSKKSENLTSKLDNVASTIPKEVPENAIVQKEFNGDTVAHLNLESFKNNSELNIEAPEAITTAKVISEEKKEDSEPDNDYLEGLSPSGDSTPNCTADNHMGKHNYKGLWGLIYQHMVSGITMEVETELPLEGRDKGEQAKDKCPMPQSDDSVSSQSPSGAHEDIGMGDHDAAAHKFELWQSDAVKMVQEAFDKILLEIPDQSSDNESITSDTTSEQELLENNQRKGGQQSISSHFDSTKESMVQDPEELQLEAVSINTSEEGKAASKVGNKSSQKISKSWSNLKNVIILKRFVKALEMVNKFNQRKPRILPMESVPGTEKINLRCQTVDERKNADEWMLDYALRQVISKLAPAQKRKVALLVQAFETVSPLSEITTHLRSKATASSHEPPVQVCTDFSIQKGEQNNSRFLHKPSYPEMRFDATTDQVSKFSTSEWHIPGSCSELKERSLECDYSDTAVDLLASENSQTNLKEEETLAFNLANRDNNSILTDEQPGCIDLSSANPEEPRWSGKSLEPDHCKSTSHEEFLVNGNFHLEVPKEVPLIYDSEFHDRDIKFNSSKLKTGNAAGESLSEDNYVESTAVSTAVSSSFSSEMSEEPKACREEANTKHEVLHKSSTLEDSEPNDTIEMAQESKLGKQKYTRLWYLIYEHMVSGSTEAGEQPLLEVAHKEEQESEANALLGMKDADSSEDFQEMNQKLITDNQNGSSQKIDRHQIEAIKIIEDAIDEIPLPDIQDDSPDDPPITGNMLPEQELQENSKDGELFISTSNDSAKESVRESNTKVENNATLGPRETRLDSNNITAPDNSETFSKLESKSKPMKKSWSNLKKVILLKRFIKSLEKARKFNPREPRYLLLEPDTEAEKVNLRHQNMEDRKSAEEWMLDHALQQVVAKLTPARRRKVELLVEAFETVTPMLEVTAGQRHRAASSPHARLIHA